MAQDPGLLKLPNNIIVAKYEVPFSQSSERFILPKRSTRARNKASYYFSTIDEMTSTTREAL